MKAFEKFTQQFLAWFVQYAMPRQVAINSNPVPEK
jgi:hypothetical protein